jgi:PAS domain S-box-containing protein
VTENGTVTGFVAIQTDITEQKEREAKLRQYERAIDGANELIAALDTDYRYLFANPAYRAFHNIETEDVSGMTLTETLGTDLFERIKPHIDRALAGDTVEYRMTRVQPDKPNRTFDIRYYPLEDETGERQGVVATFKDRTEQVERETQLAALDRMLRHTLRNDLNIILSRAELIANRESGETESDARVIERTTNQLFEQAEKEREIVELLTDPSQATVQNLSKIVTDVVTRVETRNPAVETTVDMPDDLQLRTIPEIERAIRELLENAVVHSDRDQPKVSVSVTEHDESIEFRFVDDGPKIPLEEQRVRAEEEKVDQLLHSQGMGLWLVKRIVTLVGGTLEFDEADPRGNVVTITVPKD